jgi:uncharacterized protein YdaU (DUF1376 family)
MPKGDYYFTLYYQRLLTSTVGWKDSELGAYLRLLIYQFDKGSIPSDLSSIARIAPSAKKHWPLLSTKFVDDGSGRLVNKFMQEVRNERIELSQINSENGRKGGRPRGKRNESEIKAIAFPTDGHSTDFDQKTDAKNDHKSESHFSKSEFVNPAQLNGTQSEKKANGYDSPKRNESETKAIPLTTNHNTAAAAAVLNSEIVNQVFSEVWKDQAWREQLCIGLAIKNEADLKKWLSQFNASVTGSQIEDFTAIRYKRMVRGWIIKQQQKNVTVDKLTETKEPSQNHRLKKIS